MKTKTKKAISLIVLVITIIVLAILAATVVITITNSGLINSAKDATGEYNVAQEKEQINMALAEWSVVRLQDNRPTFVEFFGQKFGVNNVAANEDGTINITTAKGNVYSVSQNGTITLLKGLILTATGMPLEKRNGTVSTGTLTATLAQITGKVTWSNEDDSVATISSTTGESITVTAIAGGQTKVTASCSGYTAEYVVQVIEKGIVITPTGMPLEIINGVAGTGTLSASLLQITGEVTWSNENDSVATISSTTGESITVTAVAGGHTKVTASCSGYTSEYVVQVIEKGIAIIPDGMPLKIIDGVAGTGTLSASVLGITGEIVWTNENDAIATISGTTGESITVTAVAVGQTKVTASCGGFTAEYTVDVKVPMSPSIGQYIIYDVSYTEMYQGTVYDNSAYGQYGWRYLGKESGTGNHLLISTGIPLLLYFSSSVDGGIAYWGHTNTSLGRNWRAARGMVNNFSKIPYTQQATGTTMSSGQENTAIGRFAATSITNNGETYNAVGDYFKVEGKTYTDEIIVRTLTLAELNRVVNSANAGVDGYTDRTETSTAAGYKDLTGDALGLFDLKDLPGYTSDPSYWIATEVSNTYRIYCVYYQYSTVYYLQKGVIGYRPVVSLPSDIVFEDVNEDGILEIAE